MLANERLIHSENLVAREAKYKDALASERLLRVEVTQMLREKKYVEKSNRRNIQQHHSDQIETMKQKLRDLRKHHDDSLGDMLDMMYGFLDEVVENRKKLKAASRKTKSAETLATARLQRSRDMKERLSDLEGAFLGEQKGNTTLEEVVDDYKKIIADLTPTPIKKVRPDQEKGKHGGALAWPLDIFQLIMEMLVHGAPPTSIAAVIISCSSILNNITEVNELPGVNFIQGCRMYIQNLCTIISDCQLEKAR